MSRTASPPPGDTRHAAAPARPAPQRERAGPPPVAVEPAIQLKDVSKELSGRAILSDLTFKIPRGQIFGLIGPSGCGKTTLVRLLVGLDLPTEGIISVDGVEPQHFGVHERGKIGYGPQGFVLYPSMTVMQNAKFVASLYGVRGFLNRKRRIREVLQFMELWDARNRKASETSGGMQKRLTLAASLFHRPSILFVDEPTAGLDPLLRTKIWNYLQDLRDAGTTVVVTTQLIEEASFCDRVGVLREGKLIAEGSPDELRRSVFGGEHIDVTAAGITRQDVAALSQIEYVMRVNWNGGSRLRLVVSDIGRATAEVTQVLSDRNTPPETVVSHTPTFDEVFMELVNR